MAWKLAQSPLCDKLWAAPGNPGIAQDAECVALDATDHDAVIAFAREKEVALVVIGPEAPLVDGLADSLRAAGIDTFGPSKQAAQLEGSKGFTKELCKRANIPTARYERCTSLEAAWGALKKFDPPFVLKADGLAAGKGVVIADTREEAQNALNEMFDGKFGSAGSEVVIEQFLTGEEASFFALTDGTAILPIGTAQDHKRVGEGDTGPNTGGMGAYSPAPVLSEALQAQVMREIAEPTVQTLREEGMPYSGVLYAGLMLTKDGPQLIEYNARFGDPECQVLMLRLKSDLVPLLLACAEGDLDGCEAPEWDTRPAITVILASQGYPGKYEKGIPIHGLDALETGDDLQVFHAGTALQGDQLVTNGGRVLAVTALGETLLEARDRAYAAVDAIEFEGKTFRRDIGEAALETLRSYQ